MVNRRQLLKLSALGTASFAAPLAYSANKITMAYNTGNPIGSTSPEDLSDNTRNLDFLVNGENLSYPDRRGLPRKSWKGMEGEFSADQTRRESEFDDDQVRRESEFDVDQTERDIQFNAFMGASGYEPPVPYASGINLVRTTQTVSYLGNEYRVKSQFLPLTTTNWATDESKLKLIGDDSLRQQAANSTDPSKGAALLGRGVIAVDSLISLAQQPRSIDRRYELRSYHANRMEGGGAFLWDPSVARNRHNGGTIISPTVPWDGTLASHANFLVGSGETEPGGSGCFVRAAQNRWPIQMFGGVADWNGTTGFDNRFAIEACIKSVTNTFIPKGDYGVAAGGSIYIQGYDDKFISGAGELHKMGYKGVFSFNRCNNIRIRDIVMDGQIVADEAARGTIRGNARAVADYGFAVSFASCHRSSVMNCRIYDFAWDGLVAQGAVAAGGASAVLSTEIKFKNNNIRSVRGSHIWIKAIYGGEVIGNKLWNPSAFAQKANAIFLVEWNSEIVVAHNRMSWIGDNAVGIGQMQNRVAVARNRQINVHDNHIKTTRYHGILVSPGEDINVHHNTIFEAGAKSLMPGATSVVLTGAITILGGDTDPINARVRVTDNIIRYPYEFGIYAFDRVATPVSAGSSGIVLNANTIFGAGRADFADRMDSGGIRTQLVMAPSIANNDIDYIVGDGIRVFGDAHIVGNTITRAVGLGINVPADTIWGNLSITSAISNNSITACTRAGIVVTNRKQISLVGNTCDRCGIDVPPSVQNITTAGKYAGIMAYNVDRVSMASNILRNNGGPGFVGRTCLYIKDFGSVLSGNAAVLRDVQNLQCGAYVEGTAGRLTKVTFISSSGDGGTLQYYPVRVLFGHASSVLLDGDFINHTSVPIGITPKSLINIP